MTEPTQPTKKVLAIDDDVELTELLKEYLAQHAIEVIETHDGDAGMEALHRTAPDLVILDVMLPRRNGFEICRDIRAISSVPIIMLTARSDVPDRIQGLELGADDYLPKPFEPRELVARMQTVWRRGRPLPENAGALCFADLRIDLARRAVDLAGTPVDLTTAEFEVLALFARNPQLVLNRDQISERLHGTGWDALSRSVDIIVSRLRQKLRDDPKHPRLFKTIWGTGYMFIGERSDAR